jgi:hypothetical protein
MDGRDACVKSESEMILLSVHEAAIASDWIETVECHRADISSCVLRCRKTPRGQLKHHVMSYRCTPIPPEPFEWFHL